MLKSIGLLSPIIVPLILAALLFFSCELKNKPKIFLAVYMLNIAFVFLGNFFYFNHDFNTYSYLHSLHIGSVLLIYPGVYIYIKMLTHSKITFKQVYIHFVPAVLFTIVSAAIFYPILNIEERTYFLEVYRYSPNFSQIYMKLLFIVRMANIGALFIQVFVYAFLTYKLLKKYNSEVYNIFSNPEKYKINWLAGFNIALGLSALLCVLLYALNPKDLLNDERFLAYPLLLIAIIIWYLGIMGNNQANIIIDEKEVLENENTDKDLPALHIHLETFFNDKKPYLNPDFKITELCKHIGSNRTYISNFINKKYNKNFAAFVNEYRVIEAQNIIKKEPNSPLNTIATKAGFGSIATFNRVFKTHTGKSPSEFIKEITN